MAKRDIDIESLLVWAYQDQCVDKAATGGWSLAGAMDSCRRLELAMTDASLNVGHECHPDAEAVHFAVLGLSKVQQALIIGNAKNGTRPDCMPDAQFVMAAVVTSSGNPKGIYDANRNRIGHAVAPAMELVDGSVFYAPTGKPALQWFADVVGWHRAQYAAWLEAMAALAVHLNGGGWLQDHHATGPAAPTCPWDGATIANGEKAA